MNRCRWMLVAVAIFLAHAAYADKLAEIRKRLEQLEVERQDAAQNESDCMRGITLLGITAATGGGIMSLRADHPVLTAYMNTRQDLVPLEKDFHEAATAVETADREIRRIEYQIADLQKRATSFRESAREKRDRAGAESTSESTRRRLWTEAEEADSKASDLENKIRELQGKAETLRQELANATVRKEEAETRARPARQRFAEIGRQGEEIAKNCP